MSSVSSTPDGGYQLYQRNLTDLESEMRDETKRVRDRYDERASSLEKNYEKAVHTAEKKNEEAGEIFRDNAHEATVRDRESTRNEIDRLRAQTYDKFGRTSEDISQAENRARDALQQADVDLHNRLNKAEKFTESATDKLGKAKAVEMMRNEEAQNQSRNRESTDLHDQIGELLYAEKKNGKNAAEEASAFRERTENEFKTRQEMSTNQYDRDVNKLKEELRGTEHTYALRNDLDGREKDLKAAQMLRTKEQQSQAERNLSRSNFTTALDQEKTLRQKDAALVSGNLAQQADQLQEQNQQALERQSQTFRNQGSAKQKENDAKLATLEQKLSSQLGSADPGLVSPAAEAKITDRVVNEYQQKLQTEVDKNKLKTNQLIEGYGQRLSSTVQDNDYKLTVVEQQRRADEQVQRQAFMTHVDGLEKDKTLELQNKEFAANRTAQNLTHAYAANIDKQRRDQEGLISNMKIDSEQKINSLRQQAEFESKLAQKAYVAKHYETVRSYERKLDDQKNSYEDQIGQLKDQIATNRQESERQVKQALDETTKGYEQKIAQMEFQYKERERTINDNYQDQIEKMKRSNALLIQRKSEKM